MSVMSGSLDFKTVLENEFEARCSRNRRYSMRAYARDLGISPAGLSQILQGKQGVSRKAAAKIADRIGLSAQEKNRFCDLAESHFGRSGLQKSLARVRLRKHQMEANSLQLDAFKAISDWYHFAILELTDIEGFQSEVHWIARALGIQEKVAELAIDRLKRLGLLEVVEGGRLRQTQNFLATPSGVPSNAIRAFHSQVIEKAKQALTEHTVEEKDFSTILLPINREDLPRAKEWIKEFRRTFMGRLGEARRKDSLYCLSIQFFRVNQPDLGEKS